MVRRKHRFAYMEPEGEAADEQTASAGLLALAAARPLGEGGAPEAGAPRPPTPQGPGGARTEPAASQAQTVGWGAVAAGAQRGAGARAAACGDNRWRPPPQITR
jgi:hypothetical protein